MSHRLGASVRIAVPEDFESIFTIEKESYPEPWTKDHFEEELGKPFSRFLVLTDDETDSIILGYIIYWVQAEGVSLQNMAVSSNWRGLGFSRLLISAMINEAVRDEIFRVVLEVRESNRAAIGLYQKVGFKKTHERKNFYHNGESAWVMELKTSDVSPTLQ